MRSLATFATAVALINRTVGLVLSWLSLAIVLVCFAVVVQRYVFRTTHLWQQDLYIWLSGAMFTGVAGFAMLRDNHVRVDIFYRNASIRAKAIADLVGVVVFLIPFVAVIGYYSSGLILRSWRILEASANVGGMPGLFVLKTFIALFLLLVTLQGMAWMCRSILVLAGREELLPPTLRYSEHNAEPAQ